VITFGRAPPLVSCKQLKWIIFRAKGFEPYPCFGLSIHLKWILGELVWNIWTIFWCGLQLHWLNIWWGKFENVPDCSCLWSLRKNRSILFEFLLRKFQIRPGLNFNHSIFILEGSLIILGFFCRSWMAVFLAFLMSDSVRVQILQCGIRNTLLQLIPPCHWSTKKISVLAIINKILR
jgi:hypothetical protein